MVNDKQAKWFVKKLLETQLERGEILSVTDFANILGYPQATVSSWMNGTRKISFAPAKDIAQKLHDDEILRISGYLPEDKSHSLPRSLRMRLDAATNEVNKVFEERGITGESPEAEAIAVEIFEKWGFKYTSTVIKEEE